MAYDKYLETDKSAKKTHDDVQKEIAAKRLAKNAAYNKAHKSKESKE